MALEHRLQQSLLSEDLHVLPEHAQAGPLSICLETISGESHDLRLASPKAGRHPLPEPCDHQWQPRAAPAGDLTFLGSGCARTGLSTGPTAH